MWSCSVANWNATERGLVSSVDQQVEHQVRAQHRQIARAIGDGAVGDLQQDLQVRLHIVGRFGQAGAQQFGQLQRALQAASDLEETPARARASCSP